MLFLPALYFSKSIYIYTVCMYICSLSFRLNNTQSFSAPDVQQVTVNINSLNDLWGWLQRNDHLKYLWVIWILIGQPAALMLIPASRQLTSWIYEYVIILFRYVIIPSSRWGTFYLISELWCIKDNSSDLLKCAPYANCVSHANDWEWALFNLLEFHTNTLTDLYTVYKTLEEEKSV